ncbi:MAG: hypothetical protein V4751_05735 [Pseudomonadota bacterium]
MNESSVSFTAMPAVLELLRNASGLLMNDAQGAATLFAAALDSPLLAVPSMSDFSAANLQQTVALRVRLGMCLAAANFNMQQLSDEHLAAACDAAQAALHEASRLPFPQREETPPVAMDSAAALPLLQQALVNLAAHQCIAFAFGGVLLGLVREGRLLPFDKDLDIVVPLGSFERAVALLPQWGWRPVWVAVRTSNFRCFEYADTGITLDVFAYDLDAAKGRVLGGWWPQGMPRESGRLLQFKPFDAELADHPHGRHWRVRQPEAILEQLYGANWRVPDPEFDGTLETPALVAYNTFTRVWAALRLLEAWTQGKRARFERLLRVLARLDPQDPVPHWFAAPDDAKVNQGGFS